MANDMEIFYTLLKYSGLMSVYFDDNNECYKINESVVYYLYHVLIQSMLVVSCVLMCCYGDTFFLEEFSDTGNLYNYYSTMVIFGLHIILRCWLILNQHNHLRLLELCRRWSREHLSLQPQTFPLYTKGRLATLVVALVMYLINLTISLCDLNDGVQGFPYLPWIMFTYCCLISALVSSIYIGVVLTFCNILKWVACSCEQMLLDMGGGFRDSDLPRLQDLLNFHDEISYITSEDINGVYGIAILLCTTIATMESIADVYVLAVPATGSTRIPTYSLLYALKTMLWMLPICMFLVVGFLYNNMTEEANKTAKILAKFSRCNTRIDKMIDKFLLKNLRQKPILTAYGFFSLDKSTLFKLFTTVFTYMVILVQFKEMESSTKELNNGS